jgi:hypothetical protein
VQSVNWIPPRYNSIIKISSSSKLTRSLPAALDAGCINRYAIDTHARPVPCPRRRPAPALFGPFHDAVHRRLGRRRGFGAVDAVVWRPAIVSRSAVGVWG